MILEMNQGRFGDLFFVPFPSLDDIYLNSIELLVTILFYLFNVVERVMLMGFL